MKYYKVLDKYDNCQKLLDINGKVIYKGDILIGNELYTQKEFEKLANHQSMFEVVNIKKSNVYFFFGARFEARRA